MSAYSRRVSVSGGGRVVAAAGPALLLIDALVPELRPPLALAIAIGWLVLRASRQVPAIGWAAVMPLAIGQPRLPVARVRC